MLEEIYELLADKQPNRYENYIAVRCLFHDDARPSMFIYEDSYRCAACGKYGRTKQLLRQLQKSTDVQFIKPKTGYFSNPWTKWLENKSIEEFIQLSQKALYIKGYSEYLRKRGITDKAQKFFGLGYYENWLIFPVKTSTGKVVGGVARAGDGNNSPSKYVVPTDQSSKLLYVPNWERIKVSNQLIITFGIIDALSLAILNYPSASTLTGKKLDADVLKPFRKKIYIFPDCGELQEANKLAAKLGWRGNVINFDYPDGTKDPNDVYVKQRTLLHHLIPQVCGYMTD